MRRVRDALYVLHQLIGDAVFDQLVRGLRRASAVTPMDFERFQQITFREGDARPRGLAVEYRDGCPVGPAAAFGAAWRLVARQFPGTRVGERSIAQLDW